MVGQAHGRVTDAGGEHFNQHGGNRTVHHRDQQHQVGEDDDHSNFVELGHVSLGGVVGSLERSAQFAREHSVFGCFLATQGFDTGGCCGNRFGVFGLGGVELSEFLLGAVFGGGDVFWCHSGQHFGVTHFDHSSGASRRHHVVIAHRSGSELLLGDVARRSELLGARGVELERALGRVCSHGDFGRSLGSGQIRVSGLGQGSKHREVGHSSQKAASQDDGLAANLVGQGAKHDEERRANDQRDCHHDVGGRTVHLQGLRQEEQGVELTGVPDHGLTSGQADQGQDHDFEVFPLAKGLAQRRFGRLAFGLHFCESGRLVHGQTDVHRHAQQQNRHDERNAPAPICKGVFADGSTGAQNHHQAQEQAQGSGGLDPGGIGATLAVGRVFSHIGSSATVFTTERQALQHAQGDQDDGGRCANRGVIRQDTHDEGRETHDQDGDQEGVLAANHVAQTAKHQSAEGAHDETGGKRQQRKNEGRAFIKSAEKLLGNNGCQRTVQIKVVPLKNGAE